MHKKLEEISEMKNQLICWGKKEIEKGMEPCNTEELGKVVDMIKDLAEAEKACTEAMYYKSVVMAMDEYGEDDRQGYNSRRYANGEYAPAGRGHLGYIEYPHPHMMGYSNTGMGNRSQSGNKMSGRSGYYGEPFEEFRMAKRNYTQTKSEADKAKMKEHANEHVMGSITTIREIWEDADPELKQRMKKDMTNLVNEMNM